MGNGTEKKRRFCFAYSSRFQCAKASSTYRCVRLRRMLRFFVVNSSSIPVMPGLIGEMRDVQGFVVRSNIQTTRLSYVSRACDDR